MQDLGKYVAISEEFPNNASGKVKSGGLLFDRKVTRIVTPGTLVDEKFIDPYENNFLLAIHPLGSRQSLHLEEGPGGMEVQEQALLALPTAREIGLAWLDLSTGEFFTQTTTMGALPSEVLRIGARELLISNSTEESLKKTILDLLDHERHRIAMQPVRSDGNTMSQWASMMESPVPILDQARFSEEEIMAGSMLLHYVKDRLLGSGIKLQPPTRRQGSESMGIDRNSMKGLEILETSRDAITGGKGSLLHAIRRTVTRSGARLLRDRICMSTPSSFLLPRHRLRSWFRRPLCS